MSDLVNGDADPAAEFLKREQDELGGLGDEVLGGGSGGATASSDFEEVTDEMLTGEMKTEQQEVFQSNPSPVKEEAEKIKKWREDQKVRLQKKDEDETKEIDTLREEAKRALTEWQRNHDEQISKTRAANRAAEKEHEDLASVGVEAGGAGDPGVVWDRVSKLCEFNPKNARSTKDTSRMRGMILQLKQNPPLPPVSRSQISLNNSSA